MCFSVNNKILTKLILMGMVCKAQITQINHVIQCGIQFLPLGYNCNIKSGVKTHVTQYLLPNTKTK